MLDVFKDIADLSPERRELLELLLRDEGIDISSRLLLPQKRDSHALPLSFAQQRLWFLDRLFPGNSSYNEPAAVRLCGQLNITVLEQSLNEIVRRHEALRVTFTDVAGQPVQILGSPVPLTLSLIELAQDSAANQAAEVQRLAVENAQTPFDLKHGPLLRIKLLRLSAEEHVVLLTIHHIVADGWSMGVFVHELAALYVAFSAKKPSPLPELPIQYSDFAHWQRQWLQGNVLEEQINYWKQQLGDNLPVLRLPTDHPRPAVQTFQGAHLSFSIPKPLSETLKHLGLSQRAGDTLFMTLLAAFKIVLHYYTGQDDIVVGTDVANRNRAETEGLIGFFVNQLVLRTRLSGNPTFMEVLERVREVCLGAYTHQDLPFDRLVETLNVDRDLSHTPLFQVKFVLQNAPMADLKLPGLTLSLMEIDRGTTKFDFLINMWDTDDGLVGMLDYSTDLFESVTVIRIVENFKLLLQHIAVQPESRLDSLQEALAEADKQQQMKRQKERKSANLQNLERITRKSTRNTRSLI